MGWVGKADFREHLCAGWGRGDYLAVYVVSVVRTVLLSLLACVLFHVLHWLRLNLLVVSSLPYCHR